jgi:NAD+ diphosphatase
VSRPVLSRGIIDRRTVARADPAVLDAAWSSARARVLPITREGLVPLRFGALAYQAPDVAQRPADAFYLGADADAEWFAAVTDTPLRGRLAGLRDVGADLDDRDAGLLVHAVALLNWHATHRHCPRCGTLTEVGDGGHVRRCPVDGSTHFPRTDPAVIMLVTDPGAGQVLLGRQPSWPAGRYSCLAGFAEPGESAEQAVAREVAEETGAVVHDIRYLASQPWPFPSSLMLGYRAVADPLVPLVIGADELQDARWFTRAQVVDAAGHGLLLPPPVSIARLLVDDWLENG